MNYLRILIFGLLALGSYFLSNRVMQLAFSNDLPANFELYGIHNIASVFSCFLIGIYAVVLSVNNIKSLPFKVGNASKFIIFFIIISICFSFVVRHRIYIKLDKLAYVECSGMSKVATRFTRKTYAQTQQICEQLKAEK
ncbi:MAG: hypothetical protein ACK5NC_03665 [Vibrio sp.]